VTDGTLTHSSSLLTPVPFLYFPLTLFLFLPICLRHCAASWKVAGSVSDGVTGIFHWHNPVGRTMALGSTQPLTEMSTRNISWGVKRPVPRADNLTTFVCRLVYPVSLVTAVIEAVQCLTYTQNYSYMLEVHVSLTHWQTHWDMHYMLVHTIKLAIGMALTLMMETLAVRLYVACERLPDSVQTLFNYAISVYIRWYSPNMVAVQSKQ
jgi:hypothetical protein